MEKVFCVDIDGVLADFNNEKNALNRFASEKGFFAKLKPIKNNIEIVRKLVKNNKVIILSVSPNEQATKDKINWIKKYLPEISKDQIKILKTNQRKVDAIKDKQAILLDDYGKNVKDWLESGRIALKISSEHSNKLKSIYQVSNIASAITRLKLFF